MNSLSRLYYCGHASSFSLSVAPVVRTSDWNPKWEVGLRSGDSGVVVMGAVKTCDAATMGSAAQRGGNDVRIHLLRTRTCLVTI